MKNDFSIIVFSLVCVIILPFLTMMYMLQKFTPFSIVALVVNVLAIPVVIICLIKEKKKINSDKDENGDSFNRLE